MAHYFRYRQYRRVMRRRISRVVHFSIVQVLLRPPNWVRKNLHHYSTGPAVLTGFRLTFTLVPRAYNWLHVPFVIVASLNRLFLCGKTKCTCATARHISIFFFVSVWPDTERPKQPFDQLLPLLPVQTICNFIPLGVLYVM